jgi:hypothetical protein
MANNQFIARRVSIGVGLEGASTQGTEVVPTDWVKQLKLSGGRKTTVADNESAVGRPEAISDSEVVQQWYEGSLEGKVCVTTFGYFLYNIFGGYAVTTNADASGTIKDHTFDVAVSQVPRTLTLARKDPITSRRHGLADLDQLEITFESGGWVKFTASFKAKPGVSSSETVSYIVADPEFTAKHVVVKLASSVAGLGAATAPLAKSGKLTITNPANLFFPVGQITPAIVTNGKFGFTGELVLQYNDTTLEDLAYANTVQAMSLAIKNTDVVIGTAANPSLTFTGPKVRLTPIDMSDGLDDVVEQTVGIKGELDLTAGYMLRAVLTNAKATY